jgi:hypothetical protein
MRSPLIAVSAAVLLAFSLSGCITIQLPGGGTPVTAPDDNDNSQVVTCSEDEQITQSGSYVLEGACPSVTIEGVDIDVEADTIVQLIIRGDRNSVDVDRLSDVTVSGTSNEVEAPSAAQVEIAGDRNKVDVDEGIDALVINGNDNDIEVGTEITTVSDGGERNRIGH